MNHSVRPRAGQTRGWLLVALFATLLVFVFTGAVLVERPPQPAPAQAASVGGALELQNAVVKAAEKVMPSVVNIDTTVARTQARPQHMPPGFRHPALPPNAFPPARGQGSGVIISADGLILTNQHVVDGATEINVTLNDKRKLKATLKGADPLTDIAILKVDASGLPAAELGDSDAAPIGTFVLAIGNPLGFDHTMTVGILSGRGRELPEPGKEMRNLLQTDAAINPGNSGGPLVDLQGRVIGINTAIIPHAQGIGFAIPVNTVRDIMAQLQEKGKVVRAYIGVAMQNVTDEVATHLKLPKTEGVLVERVVPGSPAARAGLERGDVIVKVDGARIKDAQDLQKRVRARKIGEEVALTVWANSKYNTVKLRVVEMPNG